MHYHSCPDIEYDQVDNKRRTIQPVSERTFYHIVPVPTGGWEVKRAGAERSSRHFSRKEDAVEHARKIVRRSGGDLVVHGRNGRIQDTTVQPLGYGSLRGKYVVRKGLDLTKPIHEQIVKLNKKRGRVRTP
jgi:hypothetical protein